MKHLETTERIALKEKEVYQLLTAIKDIIKTKSLRNKGFEKLQQIDIDTLSVRNQVYCYYIKGKYYVLEFKNSCNKDLEILEFANDCYSDMVAVAYHNSFSIKDAKAHFARAYCKYLIANYHSSEAVSRKLFLKSEQITDRILNYDPENSSFLWLKSQLTA